MLSALHGDATALTGDVCSSWRFASSRGLRTPFERLDFGAGSRMVFTRQGEDFLTFLRGMARILLQFCAAWRGISFGLIGLNAA